MFDVFYLDTPTYLFPHERKADSIEHACELSRTRYLWVVDGLNDYSRFDFDWEPVPWESQQTHVWPSQHQENGGTYLLPKSGIQDINRNHAPVARIGSYPRIGIDHGDGLLISCREKTRYISDYFGTLRRILAKCQHQYVWIVSSVCDYSRFDFTWHPSEWQQDMLHVWASDDQKFGDTFLVHVPSFLEKSKELALLEWFDTIHFVEGQSVPRRPVPVCRHEYDSQVPAVWQHDFQAPVVQFVRHDAVDNVPAMNLWREKVKTIIPLTSGASSVLVPREAKNHLKTQLYDYPYIDKTYKNKNNDRPLDIVFISNGEPNADQNWQTLIYALQRGHDNRAVRSDGVNGRAAAYHAAAQASTTDWFFAVFAKLEVINDFDWSWQPDRMQAAKHYIFHARNPITGLTYGHQAMIAYNKRLVLANAGRGLDFTLDDEHEVVPLVSGTAQYAYTAWSAWRTAFRECVKLRGQTDVESQHRLKKWLTAGAGNPNGQWSVWGAEDAVSYYDEVNGDFDALKKSYEWSWLASYALLRRNLTPDQ